MKETFFRLFPPPAYLINAPAGLDLSDRSLKFIQLGWKRGTLQVIKFGETALPLGVIDNGQIKDETALVAALKDLAAKHQLKVVACDVPEEDAYVFRLKLPPVKTSLLSPLVAAELPERVPLPSTAVIFDYECGAISADGKWQVVDVAAARRETIENYCRVLLKAGLEVSSFELEGTALVRSLLSPHDRQTTLIIDLGKVRTSFSIASGGQVLDTTTVTGISGDAFTEAIRKNLNLSTEAAEEKKVKFGLTRGGGNEEQFFALVPLLSALADEVKKRGNFWREHGGPETETAPIGKVILAGGQASLPGLVEYLASGTNLSTAVAAPWDQVFSLVKSVPPFPLNESLRFTTAIGLALRPFQDLNN